MLPSVPPEVTRAQRPDEWLPGPTSPAIATDEIHVWRVDLTCYSPALNEALTENDRIRAARFCFEMDRQRFAVARASLRTILGRYLRTAPGTIQFNLGANGKPSLVAAQNPLGLRFNLSHSQDLALIAVTLGREIGIDVEWVREDLAGDEIAERFFSKAEVAALASTAKELRVQAFFNCWTRKEAYVKALGEGLSFPLDQFDVSLTPNDPPRLLSNHTDPTETARWQFAEISAAPNYVAALAAEKGWRSLRWWDFNSQADSR